MRVWWWVGIFALWGIPVPVASAQQPVGMIEGIVKDATGLPVALARVTVRNLVTGQAQEQAVAVDGLFRFPARAVGSYSVEAEAPAFARWTLPSVNLSVDLTIRLDIRLELAAHTEVVTVSAEGAAEVQTMSVAHGSAVGQRQAVELP